MSDPSQYSGYAQQGETPPGPPPGSQPQPYPGGPPQPGYGAPAPQTTNTMAIVSLVLGILGLVSFGFVTGIPAIIVGNMGKKQIAESGGREGGEGLAKGGVILGWISTILSIAVILLVILIAVLVAVGSN